MLRPFLHHIIISRNVISHQLPLQVLLRRRLLYYRRIFKGALNIEISLLQVSLALIPRLLILIARKLRQILALICQFHLFETGGGAGWRVLILI